MTFRSGDRDAEGGRERSSWYAEGTDEVTMTRLYCTAALLLLIAVGCQKGTLESATDEDTAAWWQQDDETDDAGEIDADADADADSDSDADADDGDDADPDDGEDKPDDADDGDDKPDDAGDTGAKPEGACETDFDPDEPCEGSWEETMCTDDDGMLWWCEGGEWKNTDDKP